MITDNKADRQIMNIMTDLILTGETPALFSIKKSTDAYNRKTGITKAADPISPPPIVLMSSPNTPVTSEGR